MTDIARIISSLSPEKRALLARTLKERGSQFNTFPLSFAQRRLWFLDQLAPGSPVYNIPLAVRLRGRLRVQALEQSFEEIVLRHEILRTTFTVVDGDPMQVVGAKGSVDLKLVDLSELPSSEREVTALRLTTEEGQRPFDLTQGPLLRVTLYRLDKQEHLLLLIMHHIISDGWSAGVLIREITTLYKAFSNGRPSPLGALPIQYADFAKWQRGWLQGQRLELLLDYWKKQLDGCPHILELPTDRPRSAARTFRGAHQSLTLPKPLFETLKALSHREGVTLFMTLLAAFKTLLCRCTGQEDILVGSPIANRNRAELEDLIGFFVNILVLRTDLSDNPTFLELLGRVRKATLGAYDYQDLPFEQLVEELHLERDLSRMPLIQAAFSLESAAPTALEPEDLTLIPLEFDVATTKTDLTLFMSEGPAGLKGVFEYDTDLFDATTIARMAGHFQSVLEAVAADPRQSIAALPLLTKAEEQQLLREWNRTQAEYSTEVCVHQLFEEQAERVPDTIAIVGEEDHLTYGELNRRANQLAHYLLKHGAEPETPVAICVERSSKMVLGLLGILKAGAAFAPLDPVYPEERLTFILNDVRAPLLLTQERLVEELRNARYGTRNADRIAQTSIFKHQSSVSDPHFAFRAPMPVCLDSDWKFIALESPQNPVCTAASENLAYVIYTSGSTGAPKGTPITHGNLSPLLRWSKEYFNFSEHTKVLQNLNYCFDFGVFELLTTVLFGGTLHFVDGDGLSDFSGYAGYINRHGINTIHSTPSFVRNLLPFSDKLESLETIHLGGEPLTGDLVDKVFNKVGGDCVLYNGYGPTEATVNCSIFKVGNRSAWIERALTNIPIGKASANNLLYILDKNCKPVPIGVPGELHVGGGGLTRGYLNRAALTAEAFVPNPFDHEPGARLYKTGDLARYLSDGNIEFLGRSDHQVKVRGFRVELGEIEAVLSQHEAVREAVVIAREDIPGDRRLVAYYVARSEGGAPTHGELRNSLKEQLPDYMIPSFFIELETLPLTPNGKVDRRALVAQPPPQLERAQLEMDENFVKLRTPVEEVMAAIWAKVLDVEYVSIHDSFFDVGGHSLLAMQVISRVRDAFQVDLPLRYIFETSTIAGLAERVETVMKTEPGLQAPPIERISRNGDLPLSFAQQRLWFIDQMEPGNPSYNMPGAVRLTGALNASALEASLNEIVRRHESLRTTFSAVNGQPMQVIAPALSLALPVTDVRGQPEAEREAQVRKLVAEEAMRPFDLARGPLFRVRLLRLGAEEHVMLFSMHHIISDEWSVGVLVRELAALYEAFCQGRPSPLSELPIQYPDFARWQREWLQGEALESQLAYWRQQLGDCLPALQLPFDRPRPAAQTYRGAIHSFVMSAEASASLKALSRQEGMTLFMTLLAALQTLLHRYTGQDDVVVGTDVANRNRLETEGLIGFFVNHLVLRTKLGGNPTFRQLLRRVREVTLGAYAHQDLPFDKLVGALRLERNLGHTPLFQVLFVFGNPTMPTLELPGLTLSPVRSDLVLSKYDLTLFMNEREQEIGGAWRYGTELFDAATITRMSDHFETLLSSIAANPDVRLSNLELLSEAERQQQDLEKRARQESRSKKLRSVSRKDIDLSDQDVSVNCG